MSNDFGGLIKSLKTMADDYNAIAKWAATSPEEEWRQSQRDQPDPGPPYGVPPYIVVKLGWGMNERHYDRVAKMLYERRAKAPEFTKYLLRPFPPWLTEADITFVGPDANMDVSGLARRAVDVQIALEEALDFPNNLTPEQRASLVDTPEEAANAKRGLYARYGAVQAENQDAKDEDIRNQEIARIRDAVVAKLDIEDALDTILQSDTDLFQTLYNALWDLAEQSDVVFVHKDRHAMWDEIFDILASGTVGGLKVFAVLGLVRRSLTSVRDRVPEWADEKLDDIEALFDDLMTKLRAAGHALIDQPRRFADTETPAPITTLIDTITAGTVTLKRTIRDTNIDFGLWTEIIDDPKFKANEPSLAVGFWEKVHEYIKLAIDDVPTPKGKPKNELTALELIIAQLNESDNFVAQTIIDALKEAGVDNKTAQDLAPVINIMLDLKIPGEIRDIGLMKTKFRNLLRKRYVEILSQMVTSDSRTMNQAIRDANRLNLAVREGFTNGSKLKTAVLNATRGGTSDLQGLIKDHSKRILDRRKSFDTATPKQKAKIANAAIAELEKSSPVKIAFKAASGLDVTLRGLAFMSMGVAIAKADNKTNEAVIQVSMYAIEGLCGRVVTALTIIGLGAVYAAPAPPLSATFIGVGIVAGTAASFACGAIAEPVMREILKSVEDEPTP